LKAIFHDKTHSNRNRNRHLSLTMQPTTTTINPHDIQPKISLFLYNF
jgi:hypothetical protein